MQVSETWYREYQVLPLRTHPHMFHSGSGGFVLSGTRVVPEEENGENFNAVALKANDTGGGEKGAGRVDVAALIRMNVKGRKEDAGEEGGEAGSEVNH